MTTKDYFLSLIRKDFDSTRNRIEAKEILSHSIKMWGEQEDTVMEMISDFDCEFNEPYKA